MKSSGLTIVIFGVFFIFMFSILNKMMNTDEPVSKHAISVTYLGPINDQFLFKNKDGTYLSLREHLISNDIDLDVIDQKLTLNFNIMNVAWLYQPLFKEDTYTKYTGVVK